MGVRSGARFSRTSLGGGRVGFAVRMMGEDFGWLRCANWRWEDGDNSLEV